MTAINATRESIGASQGNQRSPYKPPDWPHCYASSREVPKSHKKAVRPEHPHLSYNSVGLELYGLEMTTLGPM